MRRARNGETMASLSSPESRTDRQHSTPPRADRSPLEEATPRRLSSPSTKPAVRRHGRALRYLLRLARDHRRRARGKVHDFWTYPVHGLANVSPDGFKTPFCRRSRPPDATAHVRPPFDTSPLCRLLRRRGDALRAQSRSSKPSCRPRRVEPHVSGGRDRPDIAAKSSSTISCAST